MSFKFVLDENVTIPDESLPENMINVRELYFQNGLRQHAIEDTKFLKLARKHGYIIVTKDKGLAIRVNQSEQHVVYVVGTHYGKNWYLIPKNERVSNRKKLQEFVQTYV